MKQHKIAVTILIMLLCTALYAEEKLPIFKLNAIKDTIIGGSALAIAGTGFAVSQCIDSEEWNGVMPNKTDVNAFDQLTIHSYNKTFDTAGDVLQFAAIAMPALLFVAKPDEWMTISVMYAESLAFAWGIKENMKNIIQRNRPFMYAENPDQESIDESDFDRSFPSAHTLAAFNGAAFTSYVFCSYFPNSKWKIPVIVGSTALATTVATLRVASANHFMTDVLASASIGTATGLIIPWLHKIQNPDSPVRIAVGASGIGITITY